MHYFYNEPICTSRWHMLTACCAHSNADLWHANNKQRAHVYEKKGLGDHKSRSPGLDNCKGSADRQRGFEDAAAAEATSAHTQRPTSLSDQASTRHVCRSSKDTVAKCTEGASECQLYDLVTEQKAVHYAVVGVTCCVGQARTPHFNDKNALKLPHIAMYYCACKGQ